MVNTLNKNISFDSVEHNDFDELNSKKLLHWAGNLIRPFALTNARKACYDLSDFKNAATPMPHIKVEITSNECDEGVYYIATMTDKQNKNKIEILMTLHG